MTTATREREQTDRRVLHRLAPVEEADTFEAGEYLLKTATGARDVGGRYWRFLEPLSREELADAIEGRGRYLRHEVAGSYLQEHGISEGDNLLVHRRLVQPGDMALVEVEWDSEGERRRTVRFIERAEGGGLALADPFGGGARPVEETDEILGVVVAVSRTLLTL